MSSEEPECDLGLLSEDEKGKRLDLLEKLKFSITDIKETENGYNISIFSNVMNLIDIDNLIKLESKCCPFLSFNISYDAGYTILEISSSTKSKDFIKEEFNLMI